VPAEFAVDITPDREIASLSLLRAIVSGSLPPASTDAALDPLYEVARRLLAGRYVAIVAGGEDGSASRQAQRSEGLIALAQALNGPVRAALFTLRSGDNRSGAESILTWQTGYPLAVDFRSGAPVYAPDARGLDNLAGIDAVLVAGDWRTAPSRLMERLASHPVVIVGPAASEAPLRAGATIDTGRAGLHEGGTAYRMDDVPLPLTPAIDGPRTAVMVLGALQAAVDTRLHGSVA
jgi:formylmethanofuran dehydrogenase subunit B